MQFFQNLLYPFKADEVKTQTILTDESYYPGELMKGSVRIESKKNRQRVDSLYLKIFTQFEKKINGKKLLVTYPISKNKLIQTIYVEPGVEQVIPFTIQLPLLTPLSVGNSKIWLQTELDFANRKDPSYQNELMVTPSSLYQSFFILCNEMGFRLKNSYCIHNETAQMIAQPYVQIFVFASVQETINQFLQVIASFIPMTEEKALLSIQCSTKKHMQRKGQWDKLEFSMANFSQVKEYLIQQLNAFVE